MLLLYLAVQDGTVEVVEELLNHGANVNTANKNGVTPLYIAVQEGTVEVKK